MYGKTTLLIQLLKIVFIIEFNVVEDELRVLIILLSQYMRSYGLTITIQLTEIAFAQSRLRIYRNSMCWLNFDS